MADTKLHGISQLADGTLKDEDFSTDGGGIADEKLVNGLNFLLKDGNRTMTGNLDLGDHYITGLGTTEDSTGMVSLAQFNNLMNINSFRADVLYVMEDGTLDPTFGGGPNVGDRYIVKDKYTLNDGFPLISGIEDNCIIEYNGSSWDVTFKPSVDGEGVIVWDRNDINGTLGDGRFFKFDGVEWSPFFGIDGIKAGVGLVKTGSRIDIANGDGVTFDTGDETGKLVPNVDDLTVKSDATDFSIKDGGISASKIADDVKGSGLSITDGVLAFNPGTELEVVADVVGLKDEQIQTSKLALDSATKETLFSDVAGNGLGLNGGDNSLELNVDDSSLYVDIDTLKVKDLGIQASHLNPTTAGDGLEANATSGAWDLKLDTDVFEVVANSLGIQYADDAFLETGYNDVDEVYGVRMSSIGVGGMFIGGSGTSNSIITNRMNFAPSGVKDGSNLNFDLDATLEPLADSSRVFVNGLLMNPADDYTLNIINNRIEFAVGNAPQSNDVILVSYLGTPV